MKVGELIEVLKRLDQNAEIRVEVPTHDHRRSTLAEEIWDVDETCIKWTAYHEAYEVIGDDEAELAEGADVYLIVTRKGEKREDDDWFERIAGENETTRERLGMNDR